MFDDSIMDILMDEELYNLIVETLNTAAEEIQEEEDSLQDIFEMEHTETQIAVSHITYRDVRGMSTDELLDLYNDYMDLFKMFQNIEYRQTAKHILLYIKRQQKEVQVQEVS